MTGFPESLYDVPAYMRRRTRRENLASARLNSITRRRAGAAYSITDLWKIGMDTKTSPKVSKSTGESERFSSASNSSAEMIETSPQKPVKTPVAASEGFPSLLWIYLFLLALGFESAWYLARCAGKI